MNKHFKKLLLSIMTLAFIASCDPGAGKKAEGEKKQDGEKIIDEVVTTSTPIAKMATFNQAAEVADDKALILAIEKTKAATPVFTLKHLPVKDGDFNNKVRTLTSDADGKFTNILMGSKKAADAADKVGTDAYYSRGKENYKKNKISDVGLFSEDAYMRAAYIGKDHSYVIRDPRAAKFSQQTYAYSEQTLGGNDYFTLQSVGNLAQTSVIPETGKGYFSGYTSGVFFKKGVKYYFTGRILVELAYNGSEQVKLNIFEAKKYLVNDDLTLGAAEDFYELKLNQLHTTSVAGSATHSYKRVDNRLGFAQRIFPANGPTAELKAGFKLLDLGLSASLFGTNQDNLEVGGVYSVTDAEYVKKNGQFSVSTTNAQNRLVAGFSAKLPAKTNAQKFLQDSFVREYDYTVNTQVGSKFKDYEPTEVKVSTGYAQKAVSFGAKITRSASTALSALGRDADGKFTGALVGKRVNLPRLVTAWGQTFTATSNSKKLIRVGNRFDYANGALADVGAFSGIPEFSGAYMPQDFATSYTLRDPNNPGWNYQSILHIGKVSISGDNHEVYQSFGLRTKAAQMPASGKKTYKGYLQGKYLATETPEDQLKNPKIIEKVKNLPVNVFGSGANAGDKAKFFKAGVLGVHKDKSLAEIYTKEVMTDIVGDKPLTEVFTLEGQTQITKQPKEQLAQEFISEAVIEVDFAAKTAKLKSLNNKSYALEGKAFRDVGTKPALELKNGTSPLSWSAGETFTTGNVKADVTTTNVKTQLRFYGDTAQEVGGVFGVNPKDGDYFVGAFGAKLEQ